MLAWLQHMGKKRRRPAGALDNGRGSGSSELLPKATAAIAVLLVGNDDRTCSGHREIPIYDWKATTFMFDNMLC